ncbi:hypothetical protein PUN4_430061 [Paraburkholderia unamae]|nr:hypothetical protein PUN4_430061 [Paraburkholderia unamae]
MRFLAVPGAGPERAFVTLDRAAAGQSTVKRGRRMNGWEEVGARVRVDKLKPRNYSAKVTFPSNFRMTPATASALAPRCTALSTIAGGRTAASAASRSATAFLPFFDATHQ